MDAIDNTMVFVLLFSEKSGQSNQVYKELTLATKAKNTIIPFKLDDVKRPYSDKKLDKLVEEVERYINK